MQKVRLNVDLSEFFVVFGGTLGGGIGIEIAGTFAFLVVY